MFRQRKRCYDVTLSRQEGSTMRHLANAHSVTGPTGSIYKTSFSGIWRDRSRRPVKQLSIGWGINLEKFNLLVKFAILSCKLFNFLLNVLFIVYNMWQSTLILSLINLMLNLVRPFFLPAWFRHFHV